MQIFFRPSRNPFLFFAVGFLDTSPGDVRLMTEL